MNATELLSLLALLSVGALMGILVVALITHTPVAWRRLRQAFGKRSRWRIEEVRCNKCRNQQEPGVLRYENFNPTTEELDVTKVLCDRCEGTGMMKIVIVADEMDPQRWVRVQQEISEQVKDYEEIRTESEVREANE